MTVQFISSSPSFIKMTCRFLVQFYILTLFFWLNHAFFLSSWLKNVLKTFNLKHKWVSSLTFREASKQKSFMFSLSESFLCVCSSQSGRSAWIRDAELTLPHVFLQPAAAAAWWLRAAEQPFLLARCCSLLGAVGSKHSGPVRGKPASLNCKENRNSTSGSVRLPDNT